MECPSCYAQVSEGARFCSQCGIALPQRCPACGASNAPNANFCAECGARLTAAIAASWPPERRPSETPPEPSGERRHLTVMFCDLVGSTELSTRLDIEDLQEVISAYQKRVTEVVTGFGGFVARRMGDGVLVYFGYPQAEEDDPEQAVRSGLAVVEAVAHLQGSEPLRVRVGIATGLMVVDDSSDDQEVLGVGEWPNLAARLQALAEPNTIVIADSTRRLVGSVFEIEDLGSQPLKGFAEPQRCWRVLGASEFNNRFETLRSVETPLIGRDEEVELLLRRWAQAKAGNGRVVLLCAEPGIGKSRLTVALRDRIGTEPHIALRHSCSPHHQDSALFPMIAQLERAAGFRREDAPAAKLDKLEALLAPASPTAEDLALIAELLLLPTGRYPALDLTPRRKKEKTFEALLRQLAGLSRHNPVVSIFEDLQWIDPTTR